MSKSKCSKDLYCAFLKITSQRYSSLALSEVSSISLSHDSISRWLEESKCQPKDIWDEAKSHILGGNGIIVADEIERMQQPTSGDKIHGGSKTSLVPVCTGY